MVGFIFMLLSIVLFGCAAAVQTRTARQLKRETQLAVEAGLGAVPHRRRYRRPIVAVWVAYTAFIVFMLVTGQRAWLDRNIVPFMFVPCIITSLADILDTRATLKALRERAGTT